jgi:ABC-type polysaccharide/polyol phosphate transport system ATPase subunit
MKRIEVKNVSKTYRVDFRKDESALARLISFFSGKQERKEIDVLKNISFEVMAGQILGIIGKNGTGKSTLLRLIAGVYLPNSGEIKTHGKVVYLTGLSQGSSPKLTMTENIYLMGSVMGLSRADIKKKFAEIVEFSGLQDFVDMKIYQFSTGMLSRLNFSIIMHCVKHQSPDILLLDEVLSAGGDIDFQEKATQKMEELIKGGATVVLVSHDLGTIKKYCDSVIHLEKGEIKAFGLPEETIRIYEASAKK